ncbi:hypothetical protein C7422_1141 [Pantoea ananatis]|nr:hypothetical protein C7422_1141 [Pantoea ananatis]
MINICVCNTYADALYMDMSSISIVLPFSAEIRFQINREVARRSAQRTKWMAFSALQAEEKSDTL